MTTQAIPPLPPGFEIEQRASGYQPAPGSPPPLPEGFEIEAPEPAAEADDRTLFTRADDFVRGVSDTASFGFSDEISAGLGAATGVGGEFAEYDKNLEDQRARDAVGGWERFGGQVVGAFLNPGALGRTALAAFRNGALAGGAYGFGSGEGSWADRRNSAAVGGALGGVAGSAMRAGANALGTRAARKAIPTTDDLRKVADAGYKAADEAGVIFKPEAIREMGTEIVNDLAEFGYHPGLQPRIAAVLSEIERMAQGNVTYKGVDVLRRIASAAGSSTDASERDIASKIIERIDDLMTNPPARHVLAGDAAKAAAGTATGRNAWARMRRAEMTDTAVMKAERRAASTGAGGNADNATRQNIRGILDNPRRSRGMTQAEIDMAERVVRGTPGQNALRLGGKLAPTGVVSGVLSGGAGVGLFGPAGIALPLAGTAFKAAADRMTVKNVRRLNEIIRSGGRTAQDLAKMARGGQLQNAEIQRIEAMAKSLGISVPELAALMKETLEGAH